MKDFLIDLLRFTVFAVVLVLLFTFIDYRLGFEKAVMVALVLIIAKMHTK